MVDEFTSELDRDLARGVSVAFCKRMSPGCPEEMDLDMSGLEVMGYEHVTQQLSGKEPGWKQAQAGLGALSVDVNHMYSASLEVLS